MWPADFEMANLRVFMSLLVLTADAETTGADKDLALASSIFSFEEVKFDSAAGALLILFGG